MPKPFKFKERVIVSKANDEFGPSGPGKIWEHDDGEKDSLGVRFDKNVGGHDLGLCYEPSCLRGHGWYVERQFIRRLPAKKGR